MKSKSVLIFIFGAASSVLPVARPSWADADVALDRYQPSPAGDALFAVPDASTPASGLSAKLDFSYARDPLILTRVTGNTTEETRLVGYQAISHQLLSLNLAPRLTFDVDLPVTWSQSGDSTRPPGLTSPTKLVLNDLRVGARLGLLAPKGAWPGAALSGTLFLPTGDSTQFSGAERARYAIGISVGADFEHGLWRAFVERRRDEDDGSILQALLGSSVAYGLGVAWKSGPLQVGPELYGVTRANGFADSSSKTNLEALLGARYRAGWFVFGAAGGPGLTQAPGTPSYRLIGSIAFSPRGPDITRAATSAADELPGGAAQATSSAESDSASGRAVRGPRAIDTDADGVPDLTDLCPSLPGDAQLTAKRLGCPADADGDGIADQDDQCPLVPGIASADASTFGCPADSDGDGILDPKDACSNEKGPPSDDPATNGCPKAVRVEGSQIVILRQVSFMTGSDELEAVSFELLEQIAHVLAEHPEIARLGVDGHTDDVGMPANNLSLSRRRAVAVVRWLVAHGVDERRLEARGFGPRRPLVPNTSPEARTQNRRVEFTIVKRTTRGSAGWTDGNVGD